MRRIGRGDFGLRPNTDIETVSLTNNPKFIALIERSRAKQKSEGGISSEEMRRRLESPKNRPKSYNTLLYDAPMLGSRRPED